MDIFHVFQMVGATRGTPEGFRPDQASGSQQPPPPPPNLVEVMARQTELLNLLVQAQQNQLCQQPQGGRDDLNPKWQAIRISSVLSPHFLVKLKNLLMLTPSFILLN
jgi:hypothetical protein